MLCDNNTGVVGGEGSPFPVKLHLILLSINKPAKLHHEGWPAWTMTGEGPYWMPLQAPSDRMRVGRCDSEGHSDAEGGYWHIWRESKVPLS